MRIVHAETSERRGRSSSKDFTDGFYNGFCPAEDTDDPDQVDSMKFTGCDEIEEMEELVIDPACEPVPYEGLPTTLMIRNIPIMYTQDALLLEWPNNGTYDF